MNLSHLSVRSRVLLALPLVVTTAAFADAPAPAKQPTSCMIVKHKGTVGRRLIWTALVGVPIAPGASYDLIEQTNVPAPKMAYKGKELEQIQNYGTKVVVLDTKYTSADIDSARAQCAKAVEQPKAN